MLGEVIAIDLGDMTCDVAPLDGSADVFGVRMSADPDHSGLHLIPTVGSTVVVTFLSKASAWLSLVSDLDFAKIDIGETEILANADGVTITRGNSEHSIAAAKVEMKAGAVVKVANGGVLIQNGPESLRSILQDLLTQISLITVGTPAGPSTPPANAAAFATIQARLATLLTTN